MRNRRRSRVGAGLFAVYAIASLVPVAVLGAVLVHGYHDSGINRAEEQGRAQAAVIEQMAIAPAIGGADLSEGLGPPHQDRLHAATDLAIFHGSVVRLRLLAFDGTVSFSDDGSVLGALPVDDPAFRAAASGRVDAQIMDTGGTSSHPRAAAGRGGVQRACDRCARGASALRPDRRQGAGRHPRRDHPPRSRAARPLHRAGADLLVDDQGAAPPRRRQRAPGPARPADRPAEPRAVPPGRRGGADERPRW